MISRKPENGHLESNMDFLRVHHNGNRCKFFQHLEWLKRKEKRNFLRSSYEIFLSLFFPPYFVYSGFLNYYRLTRTIEPAPIARAPSIRRCSRSLKKAQAPRELKLRTAILMVGKSCELCHPGTLSALMRK